VKTLFLVVAAALATSLAASAHVYVIPSPTHEQTFTYGSERHRQWMTRGPDRHLALSIAFTNDPFVDRTDPRQYDDFIFDFPDVRLGADGHTFYYHSSHGHVVAVAKRYKGFLGLETVRLLNTSFLVMKQPHGYLTLALVVDHDHEGSSTASL
jgi:hypothetical protein